MSANTETPMSPAEAFNTEIFVNFSTTDLERSKRFYQALGCTVNDHFTDENAACLVLDDRIYFMILRREYFQTFTEKKVADPLTSAQVLIALSRMSREHVDSTVEAAVAAGGAEPKPAQDYGFMYSRDLEDPDGNILELMYMDPVASELGPEAYLASEADA